jgi:hypothetical protein
VCIRPTLTLATIASDVALISWVFRPSRFKEKAVLKLWDQEAMYDCHHQPVISPIDYVDTLLWTFKTRIRNMTDLKRFKLPSILPKCRRRLEELGDILLYHLVPRFRPFPHDLANEKSPGAYQEVHAVSNEIPPLTRVVKLHNIIYLDEMVKLVERYLLL